MTTGDSRHAAARNRPKVDISILRFGNRNRPGHLIMRLSKLMTRYAEVRFQPLGTGIAGYPVLNLLSSVGEMNQTQLTANLGIEQSSVAQLLGRLERDGFVIRRKDRMMRVAAW